MPELSLDPHQGLPRGWPAGRLAKQTVPRWILRPIDTQFVERRTACAGRHSISAEAEHRRILREARFGNVATSPPCKFEIGFHWVPLRRKPAFG